MTQDPQLLRKLAALGAEMDWYDLAEPRFKPDEILGFLVATANDVFLAEGRGTRAHWPTLAKLGARERQNHPAPIAKNEPPELRHHRLSNAGGLIRLLGIDEFPRDVLLGFIYVAATVTPNSLIKNYSNFNDLRNAMKQTGARIIADREMAKRAYDKSGVETPFLETYLPTD